MLINGSPRKNFNTAKLLKEAAKGAQEAGAETEIVNLYDLNYKGCMSCLVCKRKGNTTNGLCFLGRAICRHGMMRAWKGSLSSFRSSHAVRGLFLMSGIGLDFSCDFI